MSLDFHLASVESKHIFSANITHNLNKMADAAGIYRALWRPEELKAVVAKDIIPVLRKGLASLKRRPKYFSKFNSPNGWGTYNNFVPFVESVLKACEENPEANIEVSR